MEDSILSRILSKLAIAIIAIALVDLLYLNWWVIRSQKLEVRSQKPDQERSVDLKSSEELLITASPTPDASPANKEVETKTVETKTVVEKETQTIVQTAQKEIFIPIGSGSTKSNSYSELPGVEVTIDSSKYNQIESAVFEATIWVEGGNGRAFAQLYNVDDKNPIYESIISHNLGTGALKTSNNFNLGSGVRTFRVMAKTDLVEFAAQVNNARIKITLL